MERDSNGRKVLAAYVLKPPRSLPQPEALTCSDHPGTTLRRILGQRWICPHCARLTTT